MLLIQECIPLEVPLMIILTCLWLILMEVPKLEKNHSYIWSHGSHSLLLIDIIMIMKPQLWVQELYRVESTTICSYIWLIGLDLDS
jgi:hypothetical protein